MASNSAKDVAVMESVHSKLIIQKAPRDEDADEFEEKAEVLMTDMTLEDDIDKIRDSEPGLNWMYHFEIYPLHADDINEYFIRLMKLASFTKLTMRKKPVSHESEDLERIDDKVMERQRKGSLHLYAESYKTAKAIMRYSAWKNMMSKELTIEITKRLQDNNTSVKARIDVDTYSMFKVRFRDKVKGTYNLRSAKVTNLPADLSRDFLDIVFARAHVIYDGDEADVNKEKNETKLQEILGEIPNFSGSLDVGFPTRSSCRAFILAHKAVVILGNKLSIAANDPETMVVPPETQVDVEFKSMKEVKASTSSMGSAGLYVPMTSVRGREARDGLMGRTGSLTRFNMPMAHPVQSARVHPLAHAGRMRGVGGSRGMVTTQQPVATASSRAGPGMPIPMTGRQKMNEKMRRNHPNTVTGVPSTAIYPVMGTPAGFRSAAMNSIGDAFKQEIASLQSELERSTQAIEAKIERLKEESSYYNDFSEDMQIYEEGDWEEGVPYEYEYDTGQDEYYLDGQEIQSQDSFGYQLTYEPPSEPLMTGARGMPRRRVGRARGFLYNPPAQRVTSLDNFSRAQNHLPIRNTRGRGGGGAGVFYQNPGMGGYW